MVARRIPPTESATAPRTARLVATWFTSWRRLLTRLRDRGRAVARVTTAGARSASSHTVDSLRKAADVVGRSLGATTGGIGRAWRRTVTATARGLAPARRWASVKTTARDAITFYRSPSSFGGLSAPAADRVASLGVRFFLLGLGIAVGVGLWRTGTWRPSAGGALTAAVWALARLGVLLWLGPSDKRMRRVVVAIWAASLAPFALGATEGLRYVALAASAVLWFGAARSVDIPEVDARTMVAWGFGGQAAVMLGSVVLRALLALAFA